MLRKYLESLALGGLVVVVCGCGDPAPPSFRLNVVQLAANELGRDYGVEIATVLDAIFGTPDQPIAPPESGLSQRLLNLAAGPSWTDPDDVTHGLYRKHCVHCHGVSGDGRGPTAAFLDPYPRDYRKGVFKFKSTYPAEKPTDEDLFRVLHNGVPGTSMPSFALLPRPEVDALVEYVKYLAMRGEMETALVNYVAEELGEEEKEDAEGKLVTSRPPLDPSQVPEQAEIIQEMLSGVLESWASASDSVIVPIEDEAPADVRSPEELAESIALGRELFFGAKAQCLKCHGPTALGDGERNTYDVWMQELDDFYQRSIVQLENSITERRKRTYDDESADERKERLSELARDEARLAENKQVFAVQYERRTAIPRNLRQGVYRGGRRRLDIFYRIHAGIVGSPMPGLGGSSAGASGAMSEKELWHIVDYVMSLPYEPPSGPFQRELPANVAEVTR